jgi:translocation and assembly module TamB
MAGPTRRAAWRKATWHSTSPSRLQLGPRTLGFAPLQVGLLGGSARAEGLLRFDAPARLDLQMAARGLSWRASAQATPVHADADLRLTGVPSRWRVDGGGTLTRAGQQARWTLRARGDTAQATLDSLTIRTPAGRLQAEGQVGWSPRLAWQAKATLRDFDPGYLAPGFEGAIHGELLGRGERDARGAWQARVQAPSLAGRLRGRALQARADWQQQGTTQRGTLDLALGASRVKARAELGTRLDVQAEFAPLQLDDLHPDARGRVQGTLALQGTRTVPGLRVDLEGESLAWQGQRAARVQAHGQLPATGRDGALRLTGDGLHLGDVGVRRATIALDGSLAAFDLHADLDGELAHAVLDGHAEHRGNAWRGTLATFALTPVRGPAWSLERPVAWQHSPGRLHLGEACLHTTGPARACLHGTWPQPGLAMDAEGLPLALLDTWWTPRAAGLDADWRGRVDLHALLAQGSGGWHGTLEARGHDLALRGRGARYDTLATHGLVLSATLTAQGYAGELTATLAGGDCGQRACTGGPLHAQLHGGWAADAALSGQLDLATDSVTWLELLSPDLVAPQGHLTAQLRVGGTPGTPLLAGEARIDNLDAELPALAIGIQQGRVELIAAADGSATLHGALPTGRGALAVTGSLDWHDAATPLSLRLQGSNVLIADTPALTAVVSPDLTLDWKRGAALRLAGRVSVDEARMDLQRLDLGVSASPDVVVLDPADPDRAPDTPLALDLQLVLGDQVTLSGHGLDGRLGGTLAIKGGDGVPMRGNGELTVRGRYRAYGSQLDITKGQLWWQDDAIDNPQVALRAERRVGDVTAGLDVSGRLDAPHATAWTDPASSEQDALAYLTLGRPLSSLSAGDAGKVDAAQAALNAGGGLLASQLAARLGLDDAGVSDSRALGGQVFGIGKQLSPRLYINYGVSLLGSGQVVLLRYLLGRGFDVQIESSTRESRGSLNWRKEK